MLLKITSVLLGSFVWLLLFSFWTAANLPPEQLPDQWVVLFVAASGGVVGFLFAVAFKFQLELDESRDTKKFVDLLFSSDDRVEEMLTAQAILCEEASQEVIQFKRDGLGIRHTEVDFDTLYANLNRAFKTQQDLFYRMYDLEQKRRIANNTAALVGRSFGKWLPSTTIEG